MSGDTATYPNPTFDHTTKPAYGLPIQSGLSVLQDTLASLQSTSSPEVLTLSNAQGGAVVICEPVYIHAANAFKKARANAAGTTHAIGLCTTASVADGEDGTVQTDGVVTATTAQWDVATGQTGGLTVGSAYYLSAATAGRLTTTAPSTATQFVLRVGVAVSATKLLLTPSTPVEVA